MNERFVANDSVTLYASSRRENMSADKGDSAKPRDKSVVESVGGKRADQSVSASNGFSELIKKADDSVRKQEEIAGENGSGEKKTQKLLFEQEIPVGDFSYKASVYERGDGSLVMSPLPTNKYTEEVLEGLLKGASVLDPDEKITLPENFDELDTKSKLEYLKERYNLDSLESGLNVMPGPGGVKGWWERIDPITLPSQYQEFARALEHIGTIKDAEPERALKMLNDYESSLLSKPTSEADPTKFSIGHSEWQDLMSVMSEGKKELAAEVLKKGRAASGDNELNEAQRIYYGLTNMSRLKDILLDSPSKAALGGTRKIDEVVEALEPDLKKREELAENLRKLSIAEFNKFNQAEVDRAIGGRVLTGDEQDELYRALKRDQEVWIHQTLERLPLSEMDLSQVQNTLAFREFMAAQPEMLQEVADYARNLAYAYEAKYRYENQGVEALMQSASHLKTAYEVMSQKALGWNEVTADIESLITRKKLDKQYFRDKLGTDQEESTTIKYNSSRYTKWSGEAEHESDPIMRLRYKFQLEPTSLTQEELEVLQDSAVGKYIYEEYADGSVSFMRPKTKWELDQDKFILGGEVEGKQRDMYSWETSLEDNSWKVGGLACGGDKKKIARAREYLVSKAADYLNNLASGPDAVITKEEVAARAKIAAFMGEWMFWRMTGRSAYWGEQGGTQTGEGGGKGEFDMFLVIGFQRYAIQESKGTGETGRVMRKIMFGASTLDEYMENYVPGMAGGQNFNLGIHDFYSSYTALYPGERSIKDMQSGGFKRTTTGRYVRNTITEAGFTRGFYKGEDMLNLMDWQKDRYKALRASGLESDRAWEIVREEMPDEDKNELEEYNNLPIVTLASESARRGLAAISTAEAKPFSDMTDFYGGDFQGPQKLRSLMVTHDSGFMSDPEAHMLGEVAKVSEGRKRVWQRAKLMKDLTLSLLEFKSFHNKSVRGLDNWNAEKGDALITDLRNEDLVEERVKQVIEKTYFKRIADKGLAKLIPFADRPFMHKLAFIYSKKPSRVSWEAFWGMIAEYLKRLPGEIMQQFK